ncbi:hypothetical protein ACFSYH_02245 [Populibacterium corticicola]|uniref:Uncharacterized protein n=1 Tax=Populibacterium corticicola TaxID=1812826 RepID=A0ABW5XCG1_9MICO
MPTKARLLIAAILAVTAGAATISVFFVDHIKAPEPVAITECDPTFKELDFAGEVVCYTDGTFEIIDTGFGAPRLEAVIITK